MAEANVVMIEDQRINLRIQIRLGDIVVEGSNLMAIAPASTLRRAWKASRSRVVTIELWSAAGVAAVLPAFRSR